MYNVKRLVEQLQNRCKKNEGFQTMKCSNPELEKIGLKHMFLKVPGRPNRLDNITEQIDWEPY